MRRILRRREIVDDDWRHLNEPSVGASDAESVIVPLADFLADPTRWKDRAERLGVRVAPADVIEDLAEHLASLSLIAIEFPGPGEGRGFSQARLLRTRLGFSGELRAVGAGVKRDLLFLMARCGFDAFELAAGQSFEAALLAQDQYSVAYQPGASVESIRRQRYFTRNDVHTELPRGFATQNP